MVGGLLGSWFQRRTWDHQHARTLAEADRSYATQTCRELSQLMDKRLYRMWQLSWALFLPDVDPSRVKARMDDYRSVLYEWNDALNRNLAAAETEFGQALRNQLETEIYEGFRSLGAKLEDAYRQLQASGGLERGGHHGERLSEDLSELGERIYMITVKMLRAIRDGRIGRHAPE